MKRVAIVALLALSFVAAAQAQPYYVRGDFNGWANNTDPMTDMGGGQWSETITGLTPGQAYEFKATVDDWSYNAPGSNAKYVADGSGALNVLFYPSNSWSDGWYPDAKPRLGWADANAFDWELMGDMNGWGGGASWYLTDLGGGLHAGEFALNAGSYQFKFRKQGSWDFSIGDDFGNSASNNSVSVANNGDIYRFEIDMTGGRWRAYQVPEPASLALLGLTGLLALRRR